MGVSHTSRWLGLRADPGFAALRPHAASLGVVLCVSSAAVAAWGAPNHAAFGRGLLQLLVVGLPIAAGLYAVRSPANRRLGTTLLILGVACSLTALSETSLSLPYTIGRTATWFLLPSLFYLLLVFPRGRLDGGLDRALLWGVVSVAVVLFFATAFVVRAFPLITPWASCEGDCPANALFALHSTPGFVADVVVPLRRWLIDLLWVGLVFALIRHWRAAPPLHKRAMGPVVVLGTVMAVVQIAFHAARASSAPEQLAETLASAWALCIAGLAAAILLGLFRRRLLLAGALGRLGGALRDSATTVQVRDALATALSDPTLDLLYRNDARCGWRDADGCSVAWPPALGYGQAVTVVGGEDGARAVAMIHDVALRDDQELLAGVNSMVLSAWRHERLLVDLSTAMADLEGSRRRIAEAADIERARIEHDLHDGAQQRLIALRIKLSIAEELMGSDPVAGIAQIRGLGHEVEEALEELRALAGGVYPPVLTDRGLEAALRSLAHRMPLAMHVAAVGVTRHPIQVESAVYFVCVEALQNAMKHAPTATGVWLGLTERSGTLRFEVRDDGPGFTPDGTPQRGFRNMHDRIEAIGGELTIEAMPGHGTRVAGSIDAPATAPG
jgi:signal transduction histidine kinase